MANDNPSIISHVSVGTNRYTEARAFYEKVLATLGCRIIMEHPGATAFGKQFQHGPVDPTRDVRGSSAGPTLT